VSKSKSKKRRGPKGIPAGVKLNAVERMKLGCNVSELATELGVHRASLYGWKEHFRDPAKRDGIIQMDPRQSRIRDLEQQVNELQSTVGRQTQELSFFETALRQVEQQPARGQNGAVSSTTPLRFKPARKADRA
jgi:transposase-like protein